MPSDALNSVYAEIKPAIDPQYPPGRFVAVDGGKVVADAPTHRELTTQLRSRGLSPKNMLIVQAGVEYPQSAVIFL
jgi:hypothetical protein